MSENEFEEDYDSRFEDFGTDDEECGQDDDDEELFPDDDEEDDYSYPIDEDDDILEEDEIDWESFDFEDD